MKPLVILSFVVGVLFLVLAFVYFTKPANQLPSFIPGYDQTLSVAHVKHGIGMAILAVASFAFAWFQSGKKSAK